MDEPPGTATGAGGERTLHSLTRRDVLASGVATAGGATGCLGTADRPTTTTETESGPAEERPPNVIVVSTDDLGLGQLGLYADQWSPSALDRESPTSTYTTDVQQAIDAAQRAMPNLRRFAEEGVRFTDAYAAAPVCAPSRAAYLTGRYPQRWGAYSNHGQLESGIPGDERVLSTLFSEAGYRNAQIGKWHVSYGPSEARDVSTHEYWDRAVDGVRREQHPLNRGFDYYFGFNKAGTSKYNSVDLYRNFTRARAEGFLPDQLTNEAVEFVERNANQPFFLNLAFNSPHIPLHEFAPSEYQERFDTGNENVDNYYAYVAAMDHGVGRIRSVLEAEGILEDTIVVFWSDNGAVQDSPQPANAGLRGFKGQRWSGGIHVPMVAWGPGVFPGGTDYTRPVSAMDVLPTALAAADVGLPDGRSLDGTSLLSSIRDDDGHDPHEFLFWAGPHRIHWSHETEEYWEAFYDYLTYQREEAPDRPTTDEPSGAVRHNDWMLWHFPTRDSSWILNDLSAAGTRRENVLGRHPNVIRDMQEAYRNWLGDLDAPNMWDRNRWETLLEDARATSG